MADTLVIIPTKGRPHLIPKLLEAIRRTAVGEVDVALVINQSEWNGGYSGVTEDAMVMVVPDDSNYPGKLNYAAQWATAYDYRYLVLLNDDHEPITNGWDIAMKTALKDDPFGIAYGPDGIWEDGRIPSAPMITASMFTALGWVALPGLHHILVDNVWWDLADRLGTRHFLPEVRIQHHHYTIGEANLDQTYIETSNQDHQNSDSARYFEWHDGTGMKEDLRKLQRLWDA